MIIILSIFIGLYYIYKLVFFLHLNSYALNISAGNSRYNFLSVNFVFMQVLFFVSLLITSKYNFINLFLKWWIFFRRNRRAGDLYRYITGTRFWEIITFKKFWTALTDCGKKLQSAKKNAKKIMPIDPISSRSKYSIWSMNTRNYRFRQKLNKKISLCY